MQVAISGIAGPLKDHLQNSVARIDGTMLGVIDMTSFPEEASSIEVNGARLAAWLPWHFDHCYNNELNRGGVLRAIELPGEGGMTGFADGIGLYSALLSDLGEQIEGRNILYRMNKIMENLQFGRPRALPRPGRTPGSPAVMAEMAGKPRGVHPAVWTRRTGKKVLHVSSWMAEGIEGAEHSCFDRWKTDDMVLWDNWRLLHAVSGHPRPTPSDAAHDNPRRLWPRLFRRQ
jgi:taurine dioxygenase